MNLRRHSSTIFPYTTLFRSQAAQRQREHREVSPAQHSRQAAPAQPRRSGRVRAAEEDGRSEYGLVHLLPQRVRSEEHTSELQSHRDLVCRLLLDKKNTKL